MLNTELVDALLAPIGEDSPCGDDLEYDAAFMALGDAAIGKPEQQFGDTVIPAVEPDWRVVSEGAEALLRRTKDLRVAVHLLRASVRLQGVGGFTLGLRLIAGLLDRYWDGIHPKLDAEDDNDPTMRLNALAPLTDEDMLLRDVYEARTGVARGLGPISVRDVAIAYNALSTVGGAPTYSLAQVNGGLAEIRDDAPQTILVLLDVSKRVAEVQTIVNERTGRVGAIDLQPLRAIGGVLEQACKAIGAFAEEAQQAEEGTPAGESGAPSAARGERAASGEINSRQDAVQMLDRVIRYFAQAEPGNPAPLLIERAKLLIGANFFEIMDNLAPNALDTIETVTGKRPSSE
jgi:type VI secretion system protein ImpA